MVTNIYQIVFVGVGGFAVGLIVGYISGLQTGLLQCHRIIKNAVLAAKTIEEKRIRIFVCTKCKKKYADPIAECMVCGNKFIKEQLME